MMKTRAIIVDLDGTLCNTDHRQHLVADGAKDWPAFYEALVHDQPHQWCLELIKAMRMQGIIVLLVSGRPMDYWNQTTEWLQKHMPKWDGLFMRKHNDFRKDSIIKSEIFKNEIEPRFEVIFCVDDRQQVVDMWRELGLTCLQCAKGDF